MTRNKAGGSKLKGRSGVARSAEVFGCQLDIAWESKEQNFKRVRMLLDRRKMQPGSLVVLPEMFATGFSMSTAGIAEPANGPTVQFLRDLTRKKRVYVLGGLVRRDDAGRFFNEAICIAPNGRTAARYAKLHLFTPGGESKHYVPGAEITMFRWGNFRVAVNICYDLRFPEVFRLATQQGAEIFVVIANWPSRRHEHWPALLRARAIENQAYVIGVNRCGRDPKLEYNGDSVILGPQGETMVAAGHGERIISVTLDRKVLKRWRRDFGALRDMRTQFQLTGADSQFRQGR